jgi:hypothetical protein
MPTQEVFHFPPISKKDPKPDEANADPKIQGLSAGRPARQTLAANGDHRSACVVQRRPA